jgi:UDP-4-amino-4,6-dideoxy-N-acetyl-beta-L-altrosamine transaminase
MNRLAILGGKPVRNTFLAYGRQWIDDHDVESVVEVLKGDYLTTGPCVEEFERRVAAYVGADYAVAVANGTAALHMACYAAGIQKGDEVIVSSMTFAASANCVLYEGATPVFADIDPRTYNIDIEDVEKKVNERTKAIIPVDFTGQSVDMDRIMEVADRHGLIVIEDAAHALGSEYKGRKIGNKAHMTMFSFHPVKPITTGEGGIITTNSEELYQRMLLFRSHGITRDESILTKNEGPWYYEQHCLGYNYRLTDLQCALGLSQLRRLDEFIERRRSIARRYTEALSDEPGVITPYEPDYSNSGWHLYIIRLRPEHLRVGRKEVFEALRAENIGVNVHYIPVYLHPYYQKLGYKKGACPNAERLYDESITLPLFPKMSDQDVEDVINAVRKVLHYYRKQT